MLSYRSGFNPRRGTPWLALFRPPSLSWHWVQGGSNGIAGQLLAKTIVNDKVSPGFHLSIISTKALDTGNGSFTRSLPFLRPAPLSRSNSDRPTITFAMFPRVAGPQRLALVTGLVLLAWFAIAWMFLPYDSPLFSFLRLTSSKVSGTFRSPNADERLLLELPGQYPFTDEEVAYIVKTGYGTQERVPALLEASGALRAGGEYGDNILVVGDFATTLELKGRTVPIHDVIAAAVEHEAVVETQIQTTERIQKYRDMIIAIEQGRKEDADQSSKAVGWELDALKVLDLWNGPRFTG